MTEPYHPNKQSARDVKTFSTHFNYNHKHLIMKAAVFHKIGDISVDNVEDPKIEDAEDIILKVTSTAICGSDLHIYDGFVPQLRDQVLGHEFMGIVEETGSGVTRVKKGDRVVVPFTIACGQCFFCQQGFHPSCEHTNPEMYGPEGDLAKGKGGWHVWLYRYVWRLQWRPGRICARAQSQCRSKNNS
jgi:hypothetical protein